MRKIAEVTSEVCSSWLRRGYRMLVKSVRRDLGLSLEVDHDDTK